MKLPLLAKATAALSAVILANPVHSSSSPNEAKDIGGVAASVGNFNTLVR